MKYFLIYSYWISCHLVCCLAALYLAAMILSPANGLQVTGMLGFDRGSDISIFYGWFYTFILMATALSALISKRLPFFYSITTVFTGIALGLTIFPLSYSILHDYKPETFENYFGEIFTVVVLILLVVSVTILSKAVKTPNLSK